nr:hypothetical protein [Tanacetum cinerariifolium]
MGDEHLNTIPVMESDEFVKSSVKNLVSNQSESEGENGCDMPACFTTFSNILFAADYDFYSVDDQSLYDQDFAGELTLLKSIPLGIDETDCDPEEEIHLIERLLYDNSSPRPLDSDSYIEEIDLSFTLDDLMPPGIEEDDYDSKRDFLIHEEFLDNYSLSLPENESFYFDIPSFSRPPAKPPDGNTGILNIKMMGDISKQKVPIPGLTITRVSNQEKFPDLLSHQGLETF